MEILRYGEVDSTMLVARRKALEGFRGAILAETQTAGRGRRGRSWLSPSGGLYLTLVLAPSLEPSCWPVFSLASGVAVAETLDRLYGLKVALKWPNDILFKGKKLAGILLEALLAPERPARLLIGLGLNLNVRPVGVEAVCLKEILGQPVEKEALLPLLLDPFERWEKALPVEEILSSWEKWSETLGRPVRVIQEEGTVEGRALAVDREGALWVETSQGPLRVTQGDCLHLRSL